MKTRTFLVTGATRGIGRALSHRLAESGHLVVGIARGKDSTFPGELAAIDLDDDSAAAEALADMAKKYSFDGVVNNVGMAKLHRLGEIDLADVDDMLRLNIHTTIQTTQAVLPSLMEKRWGRIVNVTSLVTTGTTAQERIRGCEGRGQQSHATWAMELAETGVTVNALRPVRPRPRCFGETPPPAARSKLAFFR